MVNGLVLFALIDMICNVYWGFSGINIVLYLNKTHRLDDSDIIRKEMAALDLSIIIVTSIAHTC